MSDDTQVTITLNEADFNILLRISLPDPSDSRRQIAVDSKPVSLFAVFDLLGHLAEDDPRRELPLWLDFLTWLARHMCKQTAREIEAVSKEMPLPDYLKRFVSLCAPPFVPDEEAFRLLVFILRSETEIALENLEQAELHLTVKEALKRLLEVLLKVSEEPMSSLQVVAMWYMWEIFAHVATGVMLAAVFQTASDEVVQIAHRLAPLETNYVLALHALRSIPLVDEKGKTLAEQFQQVLRREQRIDRNPGGTGRKREHEVAESELISDEEPPPLELVPDPNTPNPAEVVAEEDAVERVLAQFGERTAQLLRLCLQGYSVTEAAQQLGIAPATARKLLERARKKLQKT